MTVTYYDADEQDQLAQILCPLITLDDKTCQSGCLLPRKAEFQKNARLHLTSNLLQFKLFI